MKKLKLFSKTFLFTISLMGAMILISHFLLSLLLPEFYLQEKEQKINNLTQDLIAEVQTLEKEAFITKMQDYAKENNLNITLELGEEFYNFQSFQTIEFDFEGSDSSDETNKNEIIIIPEKSFFNNPFDPLSIEANSLVDEVRTKDGIYRLRYTIVSRETFDTVFGQKAVVYISIDIQPIEEASSVVFKLLPYTIGISLLISAVASYFYAKALTNPIRDICQVTNQMRTLKTSACCKVENDDEIGELAGNINNLYQTLRTTIKSLEQEIKNVSQIEQQKLDFLRSASHELKTPLTRLNIMIENMMFNIGKYKDRDFYLNKCKDEVNQLSEMVQEILDTSNLQAVSLNSSTQEIELKELVLKVVEPYRLLAHSKGIKMVIELNHSFNVHVDVQSVSKALSNIISNAVNYTDAKKVIKIYIDSNTLIIENECTPLPEEDLKQIFKAFYRPDFSRDRNSGGNGLGLYIVSQILSINKLPYSFTPTETGMKFEIIFN